MTVEIKSTYCRICEPNCGLRLKVVDGRITEVSGDPDHPLSRGFICARGKAGLDVHRDPDRLDHPLRRDREQWDRVGWSEAIADIGARLRAVREKHGRHSVALYFGNPIAFDYPLSIYMPFAMSALRSRNIYSAGSQDCNNKFLASEKLFGSPLHHPVPDIDRIEFLIVLGSNPAVSQMSFLSLPRAIERLREISDRGGRVVFIDPRRTESARVTGEHLFIRPDTDAFLLLAMLHVIIAEDRYDRAAVAEHTTGLAELGRLAALFPPERAAAVTGIPAETIAALARDFAGAKNAGMYGSLGTNLGSFGTVCAWLIQAINAITGRLDRSGSMIFGDGILDMPRIYKWQSRNQSGRRSRVGGHPAILGTMPGGILADEILQPGPDQIKALIVVSGNPLLTVPNPDRLAEAIGSLDLVVSLDLFRNETAALAHYVLPCTDMFERWDFAMTGAVFNPTRLANFTEAMVPPAAERRETWQALHQILAAAGYPEWNHRLLGPLGRAADRIGSIFGLPEPLSFPARLLLRATIAASDVDWETLINSPHGLRLTPHRVGRFFSHRILTPDRKINLAPAEFIAERAALETFFASEREYTGLKLIGQRQRRTHNSWLHNVESFMVREQTNRALVNPADAAVRGIADGDMVEVETEAGAIRLPAVITDDIMPGAVAVPHGWGHDRPSGLSVARRYPGVNVNALIASGPETLEKLAGMARLTGVRVRMKKPGPNPG
jgi:anaerobic selenocysteine-containing dehydrogenase